MSGEMVLFVLIGALALGSAISMVVLRHPVHAALMLVVNFFTIAVLYAVNEAQFLATVQIIVYAGAIMVLFLFVIMLLGVAKDVPLRGQIPGQRLSGIALGVVLFAALAISIGGPLMAASSACPSPPPAQGETAQGIRCLGLAGVNEAGNTQGLGALLFSRYVWPFEVASVLLVVAAIGAMVLGQRDEGDEDVVDVETSRTPDEDTGADEPPTQADPVMIGQGNPAPSSEAFQEEEQ